MNKTFNQQDENQHSLISHNTEDNISRRRKRFYSMLMLIIFLTALISVIYFIRTDDDLVNTVVDKFNNTSQANSDLYDSEKLSSYEVNITTNEDESLTQYVTAYYKDAKVYIALPADTNQSLNATVLSNETMTTEDINKIQEAFISSFQKQGLSKVEDSSELTKSDEQKDILRYRGDSTDCTLQVIAEDKIATVQRLCADTTQTAQIGKESVPILEAYNTENDVQNAIYIKFDNKNINDSLIPGYKYTTASIGDLTFSRDYLFVRKDDGNWQYAQADSGDLLECGYYDNTLYKNALAHLDCYNGTTSTQTTVAEYYNLD